MKFKCILYINSKFYYIKNQPYLPVGRRSLIKPLKSKLNSFDIVMAITRSLLGAARLKNQSLTSAIAHRICDSSTIKF
ncbi:MAG: hypothetical protein V7K17_11585 [Nostoc sp.]